MSKLKWWEWSEQWKMPSDIRRDQPDGPRESRIFGPDPTAPEEENWPLFVHKPQPSGDENHGITQRGGVTFTRTSRDGRHHFLGQTGSAGNPSELRTFTNSLPSSDMDLITWEYGFSDNDYLNDFVGGTKQGNATPLDIPHRFHCGARVRANSSDGSNNNNKHVDSVGTMYTDPPKLLGTAVDMRLRVEKGSGVDFNPDGTRMFQSVSDYLDPSLKDKYKNVIGFHLLTDPWDVSKTDFLIKEELNDIIYCDEKYSELRALHPAMRVCCLTFRPDGMGFYFAYVVYEVSSTTLQYYFVQQDLEVPWELSSAKEEYKYSKLFTHIKYKDRFDIDTASQLNKNPIAATWHINCITVSNNGKYIHAVFPHVAWNPHNNRDNGGLFCEKPRQFEITTPWDISTAEFSYAGIGPVRPVADGYGDKVVENTVPTNTNGAFAGNYREALSHGIHWDNSGMKCYVSFVPETNNGGPGQTIDNSGNKHIPQMMKSCHYFNQKAWEIDPDL
jgi:hypothetical protein